MIHYTAFLKKSSIGGGEKGKVGSIPYRRAIGCANLNAQKRKGFFLSLDLAALNSVAIRYRRLLLKDVFVNRPTFCNIFKFYNLSRDL